MSKNKVEMKNKLAASYESILIKLDDITFFQLGFSKFVTNIMFDRLDFVRKSILYAKITLSPKKFVSKLSCKQTARLLFS